MSRRVNKERTRRRLLDGVIKVVYRHGRGALTTGRVAQVAGVAQPTFYVHFNSMDEALEQASDWIAGELGPALTPSPAVEGEDAAEALCAALGACTRALTRDRKLAEVFLRNRRDPTSPMGLRWMALTEGLRDGIEVLVLQVCPEQNAADARIHAELLVSAVWGLVEAFADRRITDLDRAVRLAAASVSAGIEGSASVADAAA
jgi:AcrR family transcriptional regulator